MKAPITDSLWFWLAIFTAVGGSALLGTGGKFGDRQSGIERKYQARQWVHERVHQQEQEQGQEQERGEESQDATAEKPFPNYSDSKRTLISIGPVAAILGAICAFSLVMLTRQLLSRNKASDDSPGESP